MGLILFNVGFKFGEKVFDLLFMYFFDIYIILVNMVGLFGIFILVGISLGLLVGLQIIGNYFDEVKLFNVVYCF